MSYHKLLNKQINKYLKPEHLKDSDITNLLNTINDSYTSFERDKELLNHAFSISEEEYKKLYADLNQEYEIKKLSIDHLKEAVRKFDSENEVNFTDKEEDILVVVEYLNKQINKRKEFQDSLKRTLNLLKTLLTNLNSGILVVDETGNVLFTNPIFCQIFSDNYSPENLEGKYCPDLADETKTKFQNPEAFLQRIESILTRQNQIIGEEIELNTGKILERDYIPIYIDNEYKGHLWNYTDVTERKSFERKLKEISNLQNAILNGTDYSIIFTDTNGIIKSFNKGAEKMLGYKADEVIDSTSPNIFHLEEEIIAKAKVLSKELGRDIDPGFEVFVAKCKYNITDSNEWTYIQKNGSFLTVQLSVSCIKNASNETIGFLGIARDITEQKNVQAALKISEERYKNILEKSTDIIYEIDARGYFTYVNPVAERITGFSREELLKMHFTDLVKYTHKKNALIFYRRQASERKPTTYYEFPISTKNGDVRWIGQSVQLSDADNDKFIALAIDITTQKLNEFQLIETNKNLELLKTLINNTSDAIQVSKENGQLVYINHEASERLGIDINTTSNYNVRDFEILFKQEGTWEAHVEDIKQKETLVIEGINYNKKKNISFPVEVTVKYLKINDIGYIIANSRDITERKIIEDTVKKQKEKYQNIIANMNLGLMEVDLEQKIEFVNPGFVNISGYNENELIGKNAINMFSHDHQKEILKQKNKKRKQGISDMYEIPVKNKNGELRWWMISGAPNYDNKGNLIGSIGIHLDITEKKQLEFELELAKSKAEDSSKAKEAFLANMSHEIRTPLNAIIGMIRELSKENLTKKQKQYVYNTSVASQHLLSVLNNILDISKIEAGELQLDFHHFELASLINDVKSIMGTKAEEKNIYLEVIPRSKMPQYFIGDSSRFRQILLNLIGNAIKFTQKGGIKIKYEIKDSHNDFKAVYLSISDTGVGMDEQYLKNIFTKFSQEDSSTSRKYGGSGLGMAITKELVELMNGIINITSKKNIGTTIHLKFLLPIGTANQIINEGNTESTNEIKNAKILLVEDNEFNRAVACNSLNYHNCTITEANDGSEAIEILQSNQNFDIILMDLQMPILDGFEATKQIRNNLKLNIPIIALTANAFKSELEQCIKIGMNDYLTKPFEEEKLISIINKYIHTQRVNTIETEVQAALDKNHYSLEKLIAISRNDMDYVRKMIQIFIDQTALAIKQIEEAYQTKNLDVINKTVHRIKPSIDGLCIEIIKSDLREIEKLALEGKDSEQLKKHITKLIMVLNTVMENLKRNNI